MENNFFVSFLEWLESLINVIILHYNLSENEQKQYESVKKYSGATTYKSFWSLFQKKNANLRAARMQFDIVSARLEHA